MITNSKTVQEYLANLPAEREEYFNKLRNVILESLPKGFAEEMSYGMVGYVVPKSLYPNGYHCQPEVSLPFVSIANQKNFIGFYHMGMYANEELSNWFVEEYSKRSKYKLDMGKSCVRLKRMDDIPYDLIGELMQKVSVEDWVNWYEAGLKK